MSKLLTVLALVSSQAMALDLSYKAPAPKVANPAFEQRYITDDGKALSATDALRASIDGKKILKCQTVELSVNKSGTGVSIKNVKRNL